MKTSQRSCRSRWRLPSYLRWHSFFLLLQLHCGDVLSSDTGLSVVSIILLPAGVLFLFPGGTKCRNVLLKEENCVESLGGQKKATRFVQHYK